MVRVGFNPPIDPRHRLSKNLCQEGLAKGHDFSRANKVNQIGGLSPLRFCSSSIQGFSSTFERSPMTTPEVIKLGQLVVRFLLEGSQSGGSAAIFEFDAPSGARVPGAHSHDAYDEFGYGLKGVLTFTVADKTIDVGPGEVLFIPRGVVHRFENIYEADATGLAVLTPGILGPQYFRDIAAAVTPGAPPDPAKIGDVMRRHGLTPAP
jgi:quercetin dioxygenase-like cupin family protein